MAQFKHIAWLITLSLASSMPLLAVNLLGVVTGKRMGLTNTVATLLPALLMLPMLAGRWLWRLPTRFNLQLTLIIGCEFLAAAVLGGVAFTLRMQLWLTSSMVLLTVLALALPFHTVAAYRLYTRAAQTTGHTLTLGIRMACYMVGFGVVMGLLVVMAGNLEVLTRNVNYAWSMAYYVAAGMMVALVVLNLLLLPMSRHLSRWHRPQIVRPSWQVMGLSFGFVLVELTLLMAFMLLLLDRFRHGGQNLSPQELGFVYGIVGSAALLVGAAAGYVLLRHVPQRFLPWVIALGALVPDLLLLYVSSTYDCHMLAICVAVGAKSICLGIDITCVLAWLTHLHLVGSASAPWLLHITIVALVVANGMCGWLTVHAGYNNVLTVLTVAGTLLPLLYVWYNRKEITNNNNNSL